MNPDIWSELLVIRDRLKNSIEQQQLLVNRLQHLQDVVAATQREDTELAKARFTTEQRDADLAAAKMTIRKLHKERDFAWEDAKDVRKSLRGYQDDCDKAEHELAEAKAEIERLDTDCDREALWRKETEHKFAKAEAEIERLRKERDSAELKLDTLKAIDERITADAAIGRLVRGMRPWSRLTRGFGQAYWVATAAESVPWKRISGMWDDPAEALRAIQEVGDD